MPPPPAETPSLVATPTIKAEQGKPENYQHTPTSTPSAIPSSSRASPTTTGDTVTFTTTIKNEKDKPFQNIQIGTGWEGKKRIEASDVPVILGAVYTELSHRFNDMVDSQDERGLTK